MIPALDEQAGVARALESARGPGVERIVVDGGSRDATAETAARLGADRVLSSTRGRARQLQVGLCAAGGEAVVFLHADTRLDPGWDSALRAALDDPGVAGGAFRLRFDSDRFAYRVLEAGAELRCRLGGLPYGDQALFARRSVIEAAGGIPDVPIFEDLDLARAVRRAGRLALLRPRVRTSPRRYEAGGVARVWLRNVAALAAYLLGLDRVRVARWYHGE